MPMNFRFLKEESLCLKSAGSNPGGLSRLLKIINTALDSEKKTTIPAAESRGFLIRRKAKSAKRNRCRL
jgi:hypothetical protein